jgi:hypothetical protein
MVGAAYLYRCFVRCLVSKRILTRYDRTLALRRQTQEREQREEIKMLEHIHEMRERQLMFVEDMYICKINTLIWSHQPQTQSRQPHKDPFGNERILRRGSLKSKSKMRALKRETAADSRDGSDQTVQLAAGHRKSDMADDNVIYDFEHVLRVPKSKDVGVANIHDFVSKYEQSDTLSLARKSVLITKKDHPGGLSHPHSRPEMTYSADGVTAGAAISTATDSRSYIPSVQRRIYEPKGAIIDFSAVPTYFAAGTVNESGTAQAQLLRPQSASKTSRSSGVSVNSSKGHVVDDPHVPIPRPKSASAIRKMSQFSYFDTVEAQSARLQKPSLLQQANVDNKPVSKMPYEEVSIDIDDYTYEEDLSFELDRTDENMAPGPIASRYSTVPRQQRSQSQRRRPSSAGHVRKSSGRGNETVYRPAANLAEELARPPFSSQNFASNYSGFPEPRRAHLPANPSDSDYTSKLRNEAASNKNVPVPPRTQQASRSSQKQPSNNAKSSATTAQRTSTSINNTQPKRKLPRYDEFILGLISAQQDF